MVDASVPRRGTVGSELRRVDSLLLIYIRDTRTDLTTGDVLNFCCQIASKGQAKKGYTCYVRLINYSEQAREDVCSPINELGTGMLEISENDVTPTVSPVTGEFRKFCRQ